MRSMRSMRWGLFSVIGGPCKIVTVCLAMTCRVIDYVTCRYRVIYCDLLADID